MKKILLLLIFLTPLFAQVNFNPAQLNESVYSARTKTDLTVFVGQRNDQDSLDNVDGRAWAYAFPWFGQALAKAAQLRTQEGGIIWIEFTDGQYINSDTTLTLPDSISVEGRKLSLLNITPGSGGIVIDQNSFGDPEWGSITGTLSNQTDLQNALNTKADTSVTTAFNNHKDSTDIHYTQTAITSLGTVTVGNVDAIVDKNSVGLGNVTNNKQLRNETSSFTTDLSAGAALDNTDIVIVQDAGTGAIERYTAADFSGLGGGESNTINSYGGGVSLVATPSKVGVGLYNKDIILGSGLDTTSTTDTTITLKSTIVAPTRVYKRTVESVSESTTLQNDDELSFAVSSGDTVNFSAVLFTAGDPTADIKIQFTYPSYSERSLLAYGQSTASTTSAGDLQMDSLPQSEAFGTLNRYLVGSNSNRSLVKVEGYFIFTASGMVQLQFAQNVSNVLASSIRAGSYIEYVIR